MVHPPLRSILTTEGPGSVPGLKIKISQAMWCSKEAEGEEEEFQLTSVKGMRKKRKSSLGHYTNNCCSPNQ